MKPGDAKTTQGGPSAILRSHPRVPGTLVMCLYNLNQAQIFYEEAYLLEYKWIVALGKACSNVGIHGVNICLVHSHTLPGET